MGTSSANVDEALLSQLSNVDLKEQTDHSNCCGSTRAHHLTSSDVIDGLLQMEDMQNDGIVYQKYESERQMPDIKNLMQIGLSEPYSIYTYRYFICNWPELCFLAFDQDKIIGAIICKLETVMDKKCGYIAMLAVNCEYRRKKIGCNLVLRSIREMQRLEAHEVREPSSTPLIPLPSLH
jgi:peptide alpha-N-acetyltransferase